MEDQEVINPGADTEEAQLDLDSVIAESEAPVEPPAMTAPEPVKPVAEEPQTAAQMVDLKWRGETIQKPLDSVINMAQQAYDLDQRNREFREEKDSFTAERQEAEALINRYKAIDEHAIKNPGWFDHVQNEWNRLQQGLPPEGYDAEDPMVQQNLKLQKQVQELAQWKNNIESERTSAEEAAADEKYAQSKQELVEKYEGLNWEATDESGYTLEARVLKHGLDNQLPFKAAFLEYYTPTLLKMAEEKGQRVTSEAVQKSAQAGVVSRTPGPRQQKAKRTDFSNVSWDQLADEALAEVGE
jgi:hypothetical protein